jgi:hypothetical protein
MAKVQMSGKKVLPPNPQVTPVAPIPKGTDIHCLQKAVISGNYTKDPRDPTKSLGLREKRIFTLQWEGSALNFVMEK